MLWPEKILAPILRCAPNATNDYSRFTVNKNLLSNSNMTNGKLTYPVGLITMDEVVFAGSYKDGVHNTKYYLYNGWQGWYTMTPHALLNNSIGLAAIVGRVSDMGSTNTSDVISKYRSRTVINLKKDTKVTGTGTSTDMYKIV